MADDQGHPGGQNDPIDEGKSEGWDSLHKSDDAGGDCFCRGGSP